MNKSNVLTTFPEGSVLADEDVLDGLKQFSLDMKAARRLVEDQQYVTGVLADFDPLHDALTVARAAIRAVTHATDRKIIEYS